MRTIHLRRGIITLIIRRKTKGIRDSGSKEDEADTVYLLAKELAYDVVTGQTDNLTAALAKTSGKDIVQFAKAVGVSHPNIDSKVCVTRSAGGKSSGTPKQFAQYEGSTVEKGVTKGGTSLCGDAGYAGYAGNSITGGHSDEPQVLKDFVAGTLKDGSQNWPTSTAAKTGTVKPAPVTNDNAQEVAKDLTKLTTEEKTIVAGLLAKTIEGGEVVEIRATFMRIRDELLSLLPLLTWEWKIVHSDCATEVRYSNLISGAVLLSDAWLITG